MLSKYQFFFLNFNSSTPRFQLITGFKLKRFVSPKEYCTYKKLTQDEERGFEVRARAFHQLCTCTCTIHNQLTNEERHTDY